jgi:hypothetical protein
MQAVLKAQINKTDRNDARGIAQMMRVGLYRPVHVKTFRSQKLRMHGPRILSNANEVERARTSLHHYKIIVVPERKPATAFLLELIARLQELATVPMIDVRAYARWLEK